MNNPNDKAVVSTQENITKTAKISGFNEDQVKLVIQTVAKGATFPELQMFLYIAKKVGLDPLARQIHFTKFKDKSGNDNMTIITGIDGYRSIASKTGEHAGTDDAIFDSEDKPKPKKASVTVWRIVQGKKEAFTGTARWDEYFPAMASKQFMWNKMPYTMLSKCAEALALRKAFPNVLSDVFVEEEMDQAHADQKKGRVAVEANESFQCENCGAEISKAIADYSVRMTGRALCKDCQKPKQETQDGVIEEAEEVLEEMVDNVVTENKKAVSQPAEDESPAKKAMRAGLNRVKKEDEEI